jgi:hypothetical protein
MRLHMYTLTIALLLAGAGQISVAQAQPGQSQGSAGASSNAKPAASGQAAQPSATAANSANAKADAKAPIVLTNENLGDVFANKPVADPPATSSPNDAKAVQKERAQTPQAAQDKKAPAQQPSPQAAAASTKPTLQLKPNTVLTNDNMQDFIGKKGVNNVVGTSVDLSTIFDCDMNCYNQARSYAKVYSGNDLEWMRDLHSGIEQLKNDSKWRAFLVQLTNIRADYCKLAAEENGELARVDNFNNVTNEQINIREEYNRKLAELGNRTTAAYQRMDSLQAGYSVLTKSFMSMQELRVMQSSCMNPEANPYRPNPDYDPDEE